MDSFNSSPLTEAAYCIMVAVYGKPLHGYGIKQWVAEITEGRVQMGAGTLYGALVSLVSKGWMSANMPERDEKKKEYYLTNLGVTVLRGEVRRLQTLAATGQRILGGVHHEA